MATSLRQQEARWAETISKMVNLGAEGSQDDFANILKYLTQHFGPRDGGATPDPTAPAGTLEPRISSQTKDAYGARATNVASKLPKTADPSELAKISNGKIPTDRAKEWWTYGHDSGAMRFSPLNKITPENVGRLKVAWVYHMRPEGSTAPTPGGAVPRVMEGRGPAGRPVGDEPGNPPAAGANRGGRTAFGSDFRPSSVTPLVIRGIMYLATPYSRVAGIDPTSGKELWSYQLPSGNPSTRGVEYWPVTAKHRRKLYLARLTVSFIRLTRKPGSRTRHSGTTVSST
jgi:quinoprotein glucose dehydrogenase